MSNMIRDEHDAFQQLINGLKIAGEGAANMARFRPDQARGWELMAQTYKVCEQSAYKLAEEAVSRILKS